MEDDGKTRSQPERLRENPSQRPEAGMPLEEKIRRPGNGRRTRRGQALGNQVGIRGQPEGWRQGAEEGQFERGWG